MVAGLSPATGVFKRLLLALLLLVDELLHPLHPACFFLLLGFLLFRLVGLGMNIPMVQQTQDSIDKDVQGQSSREEEHNKGEEYRHKPEHGFGLCVIHRLRRDLLLDEHRDTHRDGEDVQRVLGRKVVDPARDERRLVQFHSIKQCIVESKPHWHLYQHGETTRYRIDALFDIHVHHFTLEALLVVAILFFQAIHLRLELLHLLHRSHAAVGQRPSDQLHQEG